MTTFYTNFGEYATDVQPTGWTPRWSTSNVTWLVREKTGAEAGKVLEKASTVDALRMLSCDAFDGAVDVDVLIRFRTSLAGSSSHTNQVYIEARGSGTDATATAYGVRFSTDSSGSIQIDKVVNGTFSQPGSVYNLNSFVANQWYYMRFRASGSILSAKIWLDGVEEPTDWQCTVVDTTIVTGGWVGVGNVEANGTIEFDYFSVGTDGDVAPLVYSSDTTIQVAGAQLQTLVTTDPEIQITGAQLQTLVTTDPEIQITGAQLQTLVTTDPEIQITGAILQVLVKNIYIDPNIQQPHLFICF